MIYHAARLEAQSTHMGFDAPTFLEGLALLVHIRFRRPSVQEQLLNLPRKSVVAQGAAKFVVGMVVALFAVSRASYAGSRRTRRGTPGQVIVLRQQWTHPLSHLGLQKAMEMDLRSVMQLLMLQWPRLLGVMVMRLGTAHASMTVSQT
jgi:hypothetical protein